jgi:LPS export ABC transporter protein LptC
MHFQSIIAVIVVFLAFQSCVEKVPDFTPLTKKRDYSVETATDVEVMYSDSARLRVRITGPVSKRYVYRYKVEEEFPDGVHVEFYDASGTMNGILDAKYALRMPADRKVIVRNDVVFRNMKDEVLQTNELIWDERSKEIYTDRFVKITRPDEVIYSRGFKTDERFETYELQAVEGSLLIDELIKRDQKPQKRSGGAGLVPLEN